MDGVQLPQGQPTSRQFTFYHKFQESPDTYFIELWRMKDWVDLGATQWFRTQDPWIGNPVP